MHRAGRGERGGAAYGRRAVATAKGASMQISVDGKGLNPCELTPARELSAYTPDPRLPHTTPATTSPECTLSGGTTRY